MSSTSIGAYDLAVACPSYPEDNLLPPSSVLTCPASPLRAAGRSLSRAGTDPACHIEDADLQRGGRSSRRSSSWFAAAKAAPRMRGQLSVPGSSCADSCARIRIFREVTVSHRNANVDVEVRGSPATSISTGQQVAYVPGSTYHGFRGSNRQSRPNSGCTSRDSKMRATRSMSIRSESSSFTKCATWARGITGLVKRRSSRFPFRRLQAPTTWIRETITPRTSTDWFPPRSHNAQVSSRTMTGHVQTSVGLLPSFNPLAKLTKEPVMTSRISEGEERDCFALDVGVAGSGWIDGYPPDKDNNDRPDIATGGRAGRPYCGREMQCGRRPFEGLHASGPLRMVIPPPDDQRCAVATWAVAHAWMAKQMARSAPVGT